MSRPQPPGQAGALSPELAELLARIVPAGGTFGHREHLHLAFAAVRRHGAAGAGEAVIRWIRQLAVSHGAPGKFHVTVTLAWTGLVAHHAAACPAGTDFADFLQQHPALLDKQLLTRHYSPRLLTSPAARAGWVEPDLAAFPGTAGCPG